MKSPINIIGLEYPITITETHLFAGCQGHEFKAWKGFTSDEIFKMDGEKASKFYPKLLKIIEMFVGK